MLEVERSLLVVAGLPQGGPVRLRWLLDQVADPTDCVAWLREKRYQKIYADRPKGLSDELLNQWCYYARRCDVDGLVSEHKNRGIKVLSQWSGSWPFDNDIEPPVMIFAKGDLELLTSPKVAIVGTRRCTSVGRRVASDFAAALADLQIAVVSGLAAGIDKAAHAGCLRSADSAIAVVGSGLDQIYPKSNSGLWDQVSDQGLLLSEYVLGTAPKKWHFPARNRLIAAISDGVVVIESHEKGGSLSTAEEALARDKPLMAVPGSILSAASTGSNALIADGAVPVMSVADVVSETFGLAFKSSDIATTTEEPNLGSSLENVVLREARSGSGSLENIFVDSDATVDEVFMCVHLLAKKGFVRLVGSKLEPL